MGVDGAVSKRRAAVVECKTVAGTVSPAAGQLAVAVLSLAA